jgi:DNA-binding SARP family transcriptional activator/tetratricopeptide (TPR) repeat protein
LGADAIASRGGEDLAVSAEVVGSDVAAFEAAVVAGRTAEAGEHYRGDFLAGFHVPDGSQEFEEWIQGERRRLRALAVTGAWRLARGEEGAGNAAGAAYWARRDVDLDPLDESGIAELMRLLARVGDRAGAVRAHREYARRAREELGLEPGPELRRLADSMWPAGSTARIEADGTRGAVDSESAGSDAQATHEARVVAAPPATRSVDSGAIAAARGRRGARPLAPVLWLTAGGVALVLALAAVLRRGPREAADPTVVAVGPITDLTADTTEPSNVPADLLSTSLARLAGVHVIPVTRIYDLQAQLGAASRAGATVIEPARQAGAAELIQGTLSRSAAGRLQLDLEVVELGSGEAARSYRAAGRDLFAAVDQATTLVARRYGVAPPRERITRITTPSLLAYRFYEQGLREFYQHGDQRSAHRLFRAALAEDSTFAMAAYYAFRSAGDGNPDAAQLVARAVRMASRTADRERPLIHSLYNQEMEEPIALAQAETLVARYPAEPDGHLALGVARVRAGDFPGAIAELARVVTMDSVGLRGSAALCRACDAYDMMATAYASADSLAAAERTAREFVHAQPRSVSARLALAWALAYQGRYQEALDEFRTADRLAPGTAEERALAEAVFAIYAGEYDEADRRLISLEQAPEQLQSHAQWLLTLSLRNQAGSAKRGTWPAASATAA